jgi:diguanylate cyclase (GGDEF)-like protein
MGEEMKDKEVRDLEILGHRIVEEAGEDTAQKRRLPQIKNEKKEVFYSDLLYALMNLRFGEGEAKAHWDEILKHKWEMSEKLGRNVGVRVAALDYFKNIKGLVKSPKIVEVSEFAATSWRAMTDSLTELYNHRYFQNAVNRRVNSVRQDGGCFSILLFDIDFFKVYNDSNGHIAGDVVLVETARILKEHVREGDVAARYGGEEFGLVIGGAGKREASEIAERIRVRFRDFDFANEEVMPSGEVTISGGVATCPEDGKMRKKLIGVVDNRLYEAKRKGRDRICAYELRLLG